MSNQYGRLGAALLTGVAIGCSTGEDSAARTDTRTAADTASGHTTNADVPASHTPTTVAGGSDSLAEGDVRIVTQSGQFDLALIGDSISSGLSPKAIQGVRAETDTMRVSGTGFAAEIEKMVKGTVQDAVGKRVSFPLSEVREVRYDGEKLVFEWAGEPRKIFDQAKVNGKPFLASFTPEDARRFAAAVAARKGKPRHL